MKNVTKNNRYNRTAKRQEGGAVTQGPKIIYEPGRKGSGRRRSTERKKEICTGNRAAHALLKNVFLPKLSYDPFEGESPESIESGFYESMKLVAEYYGISPDEKRQYDYPVNLALAKADLEKKIRESGKEGGFSELKILSEEKRTHIRIRESLNMGMVLYYIPVMPVWEMHKSPERKAVADLFLSVFCYLKKVVGVPMYSDGDCFLWWQYEFMTGWLQDDDDPEEEASREANMALIEQYMTIGREMDWELHNNMDHLDLFKKRVEGFVAGNEFEQKALKIARGLQQLRERFGDRDIFKNAYYDVDPDIDEDAQDYGAVVTLDKVVSFIPSTNDDVYGWLEDTINTEFNECSIQEEPTAFRDFDGREQAKTSLEFEAEIFELIEQLCDILNNMQDA